MLTFHTQEWKCFSDSIGDLYHLQTLRATKEYGGEGCLRKLPDTFKLLTSLRHLYIPDIKLPPEIGKLIHIQTLPYFRVGDKEGCGIMELGSLNNLKGEIEIHNLEKVRGKNEAKYADLFHKPNIVKLMLVWNESREDDKSNDEKVLEGLQPDRNLKILEIKEFKGNNFPLWTLRMEVREDPKDHWIRLDNLLEVQLSDCKECEEIPMLGQLPRLKSLYLRRLFNVKSIGFSFYGIKDDEGNKETSIVFPALEKLELIDMKNLTSWIEVDFSSSCTSQPHEVLVFRRLEYLKIANCRQLKSAPSHFPCLKELVIDNMESGLPMASICGSKLTTLAKLFLHGVDRIVCLPNELFNKNRDLVELHIRFCNNLMYPIRSLGGGGASLRRLMIFKCQNSEEVHKLYAPEELIIWGCPNLKKLISSQGFTSSLRRLLFLGCSGLINFPCEMLKSCTMCTVTRDVADKWIREFNKFAASDEHSPLNASSYIVGYLRCSHIT